MKTLVVYSSLTNNTKKVAEAAASAIEGAELRPVSEDPNPNDFDLILVGFWVDKGLPDAATKVYLEKIKGKKAAFFFTLGAYPDSDHADDVRLATEEILKKGGNEILGSFRCQGKVDPALLERMKKMLPPDHPHAQMTEERKARLAEAAKHPNEEDLAKAADFARAARLQALGEKA
ncbi:MAG: flavodoxin family protein [Deltaproteobacteria bacterium]|jgi:flavodoxin|nr:flavodoxin family protein [Deltaproteobacteria bacterium]